VTDWAGVGSSPGRRRIVSVVAGVGREQVVAVVAAQRVVAGAAGEHVSPGGRRPGRCRPRPSNVSPAKEA